MKTQATGHSGAHPRRADATALRRLILVRHGETVGQSSIRYYGRTDVALSDSGEHQMERVRAALASEAVDAVYTSTLVRTTRAADIISPHHAPHSVAGFDEVDFGRWEGWTREEIAAREPELFEQWRLGDGDFTYPDGDSVGAFRARVAAAFRALVPAAPERVLIVAHKGVIATIVQDLLDLSAEERASWPIALASIHIVTAAAGRWRAERINDTRHLDGLP